MIDSQQNILTNLTFFLPDIFSAVLKVIVQLQCNNSTSTTEKNNQNQRSNNRENDLTNVPTTELRIALSRAVRQVKVHVTTICRFVKRVIGNPRVRVLA